MQHKAQWFYIQAQVHTHASDHREVGTKGVIATSVSPGVLPSSSWSSIKEPPRSSLLVTGRASHVPQPGVAGTLQCTVAPLSSFLPQKMHAPVWAQPLPPFSQQSLFRNAETIGRSIRIHPCPRYFPQLFQKLPCSFENDSRSSEKKGEEST